MSMWQTISIGQITVVISELTLLAVIVGHGKSTRAVVSGGMAEVRDLQAQCRQQREMLQTGVHFKDDLLQV